MQPGFMRTDMTKGVGYDKYYDSGGGTLHLNVADIHVDLGIRQLFTRMKLRNLSLIS